MRSLKTGLFTFAAAGLFGMVAVIGCSADGAGDVIEDPNATEPTGDDGAQLPPSNPGSSSSSSSGSTSKDAGKDATKTDSGKDAGPPPPNPGDPCTKIDQIFKKQCGACGTQEAVCLAGSGGDGGAGTVSDYGACNNEVAGGCIPGTTEDVACGNCGTAKKTCNQYCAWSTGTCTGQPTNSCKPGSYEYTAAGCPANQYRKRDCQNSCVWTNYAGCAEPVNANQLTISASATGTVSGTYTLSTAKMAQKVTGTCGSASVSTTNNHPYEIVEVRNPTGQTAKISAWLTGTPAIDTVMAAYATTLEPQTETELKNCAKGVNDFCPADLPCSTDDDWSGLTGTNQVTIPPNGRVLIRFQAYYSNGGTQATTGNATLTVRTDALQ